MSRIIHACFLHHRNVLRLDRKDDLVTVLEQIFNFNRWGETWRNGIYNLVHYHSMIRKVLGIARGTPL